MPLIIYKTLAPGSSSATHALKQSSMRITAYGYTAISQYGMCELMLDHHDRSEKVIFYVVNTTGPVIISLPTCRQFGLVTLNYALTVDQFTDTNNHQFPRPPGDSSAKVNNLHEYADVFQGIGCFKGEYSIAVDPTIPPMIYTLRRAPIALQEPLKRELNSLIHKDTLLKVNEQTDWVNSCVCVTKPNGNIHLCLDPKDLNHAIKRPHRYIPTLEDVLSKLLVPNTFLSSMHTAVTGMSVLTKCNTPFSSYCYNRLLFGLASSQDVFQNKVDEIFGDIPGCTAIVDDPCSQAGEKMVATTLLHIALF